MASPQILGIVNITEDSFSDGGRYLDPAAAIAHARLLVKEGAHAVDLGAASSNPHASAVSVRTEIERLQSVIPDLKKANIPFSVDSFRPEVQKFAMEQGADFLNDIQGFPEPDLYPGLARYKGKLILMHSIQRKGIATTDAGDPEHIFGEVVDFFKGRVADLEQAGVATSRLILDPGMGFFLGSHPDSSLRILAGVRRLKEIFGIPVLISLSRKSFLGTITGREVHERGAATLAAELWAAEEGADYIRTHEPGALRDALLVRERVRQFRM